MAKPNGRGIQHHQDKLKSALHAKTQEGKTFKTNVRHQIIWDAAADEALCEAVPTGFVFTDIRSQDGPAVWRDIAGRLNLDAKYAGSLSDRYSRLTADSRSPDGFDLTAHLDAAWRKRTGLLPGEVIKRKNPYLPNPSEPEREYAMAQTLEALKALVPDGVATRSPSQAVRRSTPSGTRALRASSVCAMAYSRSGSDGFGR